MNCHLDYLLYSCIFLLLAVLPTLSPKYCKDEGPSVFAELVNPG